MKRFILSICVLLVLLTGCQEREATLDKPNPPGEQEVHITQQVDEPTDAGSLSTSPSDDVSVNQHEETFYLNDQTGWKAEYKDYGMHREDMVLYKSIDGGTHWTAIASSDDAHSNLPSGMKSGFVFSSETDGWMTTNAPWQGKVGLSFTNDGGVTWKEKHLDVPETLAEAQLFTFVPLFVTEDEGIIAARSETSAIILYLTSNSGQDWKSFSNSNSGEYKGISWSVSEDSISITAHSEQWTLHTSGNARWLQS